jgi:hypothetical protein
MLRLHVPPHIPTKHAPVQSSTAPVNRRFDFVGFRNFDFGNRSRAAWRHIV